MANRTPHGSAGTRPSAASPRPPTIGIRRPRAALIGLVIGALQVLTQVREPGFAFASRLVAISLVLVVAGPWMLATAEQFTLEVWALITEVAS